MSFRRITFVISIFIAAILVLVDVLGGQSLLLAITESRQMTSNLTSAENAHKGTTNWQIPSTRESTYQIQAYAYATSVSAGHSITFYVST